MTFPTNEKPPRGILPEKKVRSEQSAQRLSDLIRSAARELGWDQRINLEKARGLIADQIPPEIRQCVISIRITPKGYGYIRTNSAAARCELSFRIGKIKEETNRKLGMELLKELKIY